MPSPMHRHVWHCCCAILLYALQTPAVAVDYDNGSVNIVDTDIQPQNIRIFDGTGGVSTTVNVQSGANYDGLFAFESSIANIHDGSISTQDINALNNSMVSIFGGSIAGADADNDAYMHISGGALSRSGRVVGGFGTSTIDITGGSFSGSDISIIGFNSSLINIYGGDFTGDIRSDHDSSIWVSGGQIPSIVATDRSTLTLAGSSFNIPAIGGDIDLSTPYIIDFTLNDTITGVLADGSILDADIFNSGTIGSRIILTSVPLPGAALLLGSGLACLFGIAKYRRAGR